VQETIVQPGCDCFTFASASVEELADTCVVAAAPLPPCFVWYLTINCLFIFITSNKKIFSASHTAAVEN